ncbi:hypothetical protein LZ318_28935 [Saccharopolyspora indica]|uniref:hypothetical protein n=1 Tax=Saccharopolyspora indica TaxID=1229659 RepID=UPI0022EA9FBB|nr:hypothetical protein [Saccharopolyspora indica]MDA3646290.1 hypothetical protein [Saccharopolyspora indica]
MSTPALPETGRAVRAMHIGLALTVLAALAPLIDVATVDSLGDHVRSAYPDWPDDLIATDRNAIAGYLAVIGVLGIAGWLWSIVGTRKHARWARVVSTIMFALGASVALLNLSLSGGAYTNVVPPLHSALGTLPALAGLAAVVLLWKR